MLGHQQQQQQQQQQQPQHTTSMEHILQPGQAAAHAQSRRMQHPQAPSPTTATYAQQHAQHSAYAQPDASNGHPQQYFNPANMMYGSPNVYPAAYTNQPAAHQGYAPAAAYNYAAHGQHATHMAQHQQPHHYVQSYATQHQQPYATQPQHTQPHTYGNYTQVTPGMHPAMTPMQAAAAAAAAAQSQANAATLLPAQQQSQAGPSRTKGPKQEAQDIKPARPGPYDMPLNTELTGLEGMSPVTLPKRPKKERDPNKPTTLKSHLKPPKQAPSAWQVYFTEELKKMKELDSGQRLNVAHVAKDAGARYAALPEEEKKEFKVKSLQLKAEWERQMEEWRQTLTPEDIKQENAFRTAQRKAGKSRKGNLKDPHAPKKPLSAYFLFLRAIRADPVMMATVFQGETETTKQSVLAAAKWRALTEADKQPYLDKAETDKAEYERQRRDYELQNGLEPTVSKPKSRPAPAPSALANSVTAAAEASGSSPPKREDSAGVSEDHHVDVEGLDAHTVHPDDFKIEGFTDDFHVGADHL